MRIAYFSPLNPKRSGISDYSEELLPFLAQKGLKIDVFIDEGYQPSNKNITKMFKCLSYTEFESYNQNAPYDLCLYHMGNNTTYHEYIYEQILKMPGIVILHDYALHHFIAMRTFARNKYDEYIAEMEYNYGPEGVKLARDTIEGRIRPLWETSSLDYPANRRVLENALGVIVHSNFVREKVQANGYSGLIETVPMHCIDIEKVSREQLIKARRELKIDDQLQVFASFGLVSSAKRIETILNVLARYVLVNPNFKYFLIGEILPGHDFRGKVKELNLDNHVVFSEYVDLDMFKKYMIATDICLNLRFPTQGETSATLSRILGMGKCTFVSNVGSFKDIPDNAVIKIDVSPQEEDILFDKLVELYKQPKLVFEYSENAYDYISKNCTVEKSASQYYEFCKRVLKVKKIDSTLENISECLLDIDISDEKIILALSQELVGMGIN